MFEHSLSNLVKVVFFFSQEKSFCSYFFFGQHVVRTSVFHFCDCKSVYTYFGMLNFSG